MHLGPFGCIATGLFSENPNWPKSGFHENKWVAASTGNTRHFLVLFGFFPPVTVWWKNPKFDNCIAKFCCASGNRNLFYFLHNFEEKKKNRGKYKNSKKT